MVLQNVRRTTRQIRQSDLIVKEDYLQIGYQLEDEKEYQVEEHKFIRLILKTEGADC